MQKMRRKAEQRKARKGKQVDDLAERLAQATTVLPTSADAAPPGPGAMETSRPSKDHAMVIDRAALKMKLRAKLAGESLGRTQGIAMGAAAGPHGFRAGKKLQTPAELKSAAPRQ